MKYLQVGPIIHGCDTFKEFVAEFSVNQNDLVLTNKYIYEPLLKDCDPGCKVIYQEEYGVGEPTDLMVAEIMKEVDKHDYHRMIAIGGGAVMDIAKLLVLKRTETIDDLYADPKNVVKDKPLIAVPTTAGTGSEITNIAVMNRTKMDLKMGIQTPDMFPDFAVLIPQMLNTVPYKVFANTTVDALIHATEAYISKDWTPMTEMYSIHAIEMILKGYMEIRDKGEAVRFERNREYMLASTYAGLAFVTAGCGTVHACSFAFGGKYHAPHGEACYQFFVETLRYFAKHDPNGRMKDLDALLCRVLGVEKDGVGALSDLLAVVAPLEKMSAYGATEADIPVFAKMTHENQQRLLQRNAYKLGEADLYEIFAARL